MNPTTLKHPVTLSQVAMPVQVCYIIPVDAPAEMLTEIFRECYEWWGGRDALLIPTLADGSIDETYWSWARSLEPDIIYSYVPLAVPMLERVDRELMPSTVIIHPAEKFGHGMRPWHDPSVRGLPSLSVLPMLGNTDRIGLPGRYSLISACMGWAKDPFITDTFGLNPYGPGWIQTRTIRKHVDLIALGSHEGAQHRDTEDPEIADPTILLRVISDGTYPAAISMAQLSGIGYEHILRQRASAWRHFNIVVGDTAIDRIAFWNCRIGVDDYQRKNIVAVRVDEAKLADPGFIVALARVSRWNTSTSQNGPSHATVRSSSVAGDRLQPIVDALRPLNVQTTIAHFDNVNDCTPAETDKTVMIRGGTEQRYTGSVAPLTKIEPLHLTRAGPISAWFLTGGWTVQVTIKREDGGRLGSSIARLAIPRRWQAVRSLAGGMIAKATVEGDLRLYIRPGGPRDSLSFTDEDAEFVACLFRPYHHLTTDPRNAIPQPAAIYPRISSAGRHLRGLLNKLGSIRSAAAILEDEFWKSVFLDMAVPREVFDDAKRADLAERLKKPIQKDGPATLATDADFRSLAETVAQIAPDLKTPVAKRSFDWFLMMYRKAEECKRARDPKLSPDDIERRTIQEVEEQLRRRCAEGVLIQGYDWKCPRCLHRNWSTVGALGPILTCEVCDHREPISSHFLWDFLLDGYVALGLRERGLRGLVWILGYLSWSSQDSFMFSPPLDLIQNGVNLSDVDIACVVDNKFIIGEVKESDRKINEALGDRLIEHARIIRPDVVVLACYDPDSLATVTKQTDRIRDGLKDLDIDVRPMVPAAGQDGVPAMLMARGMWMKERLRILALRPARAPMAAPPVAPPSAAEPPPGEQAE